MKKKEVIMLQSIFENNKLFPGKVWPWYSQYMNTAT